MTDSGLAVFGSGPDFSLRCVEGLTFHTFGWPHGRLGYSILREKPCHACGRVSASFIPCREARCRVRFPVARGSAAERIPWATPPSKLAHASICLDLAGDEGYVRRGGFGKAGG